MILPIEASIGGYTVSSVSHRFSSSSNHGPFENVIWYKNFQRNFCYLHMGYLPHPLYSVQSNCIHGSLAAHEHQFGVPLTTVSHVRVDPGWGLGYLPLDPTTSGGSFDTNYILSRNVQNFPKNKVL